MGSEKEAPATGGKSEVAEAARASANQGVRQAANALAEAEVARAVAEQGVSQATDAPAQAKARRENAQKDIESGLSSEFYKDIANKANMEVSAVQNVLREISQNEYAKFIRGIMQIGATSFSRNETTRGNVAVHVAEAVGGADRAEALARSATSSVA
jgi:hypothetical protein